MDAMLLDSQQVNATGMESEACELWSCGFCGAECRSARVERSCCGSVELRPDCESGAADAGSIRLQVSQSQVHAACSRLAAPNSLPANVKSNLTQDSSSQACVHFVCPCGAMRIVFTGIAFLI
jgi:hypothetical protein